MPGNLGSTGYFTSGGAGGDLVSSMRGWPFEGSPSVSALLVEDGVAGGGSPVGLGEGNISSGWLGRGGDLVRLSRSRVRLLPRGEFLLGLG